MNIFAADVELENLGDAAVPVLVFIAGFLGIIVLVSAIWYIIRVIAYWKMFNKMGVAGWKSIIPFLSDYHIFNKVWSMKAFWIWLIISAIEFILGAIQIAADPQNQNLVLVLIMLVFAIAGAVIYFIKQHKTSVAFGHGIGCTLGLIFLEPVFILYLGFGGSQYQGDEDYN